MFTFEHDPAAEKERFVIKDDREAEWALGKIAEARADLQKWETFYKERRERVKARIEGTIAHMSALLREYFDTQERHVTDTGIEKPTIREALHSPKKKNRTQTATQRPIASEETTLSMFSIMSSPELEFMVRVRPKVSSLLNWSTRSTS